MIQSVLFSVAFILLIYAMALTTRKDHKKVILYRLARNHARMLKLYGRLEELLFLRDSPLASRRFKTMSYDLYLAGIKKQNDLYDKEMEELRKSKFNSELEQYYRKMIRIHDNELLHLQSEIERVENTRLWQRSQSWSA